MKRAFSLCAAALMLTLALPVSALATRPRRSAIQPR